MNIENLKNSIVASIKAKQTDFDLIGQLEVLLENVKFESNSSSSIAQSISSTKYLQIRARTNNNCVYCGKFVKLSQQSFEHLFNKRLKLFGNQLSENLVISHLACNKDVKNQVDKTYDVTENFHLPTKFDNQVLAKIASQLLLAEFDLVEKYLFNRPTGINNQNVKNELKSEIETYFETLKEKQNEVEIKLAQIEKLKNEIDSILDF